MTDQTPLLSDAEEIEAIDKILLFRAHKLSPSGAVKWIHELYTEQCVTLQEVAQRHKIGHGGEKLAKVAAEAIDKLEADRQALLSVVQEAVDVIAIVAKRRGPFHADIEAHRILSKIKSTYNISPKP